MPDVFEDTVGTYDLTITTSADWSQNVGDMPNGDNSMSADGTVAATYNLNGDDFDFTDGTAWTVEFWIYYTTARAFLETIMICDDLGGGDQVWHVYFDADEAAKFQIGNTIAGVYLGPVSTGALTTSTWHYVVCEKETGDVVNIYLDCTLIASDSSTSGTANAADAGSRLFFGVDGSGVGDINTGSSGVRVSKLAIYNRLLTSGEMNDHYLAMIAS